MAEEKARINSGGSACFGIRLGFETGSNRVFVIEAFENAPGLGAGMDRGTELLAIGTTSSNLVSVSSLMASGGPQAVIDALASSEPGVTRVLLFRTVGGASTQATWTKTSLQRHPSPARY